MWRLLKAELRYHTVGIGVIYTLFFLYFTLVTWTEKRETWILLKGGIMFAFFFLLFNVLATKGVEKRDRFFTSLPVSPDKVALARILYVSVAWTVLLALYIVVLLVRYPLAFRFHALLEWVSVEGLILAATAYSLIASDMLYCSFDSSGIELQHGKKIILLLLRFSWIVVLFLVVVLQSGYPGGILDSGRMFVRMGIMHSPIGLLIFVGLGLLAARLSLSIFGRRRSYIV